MKLMHQVSHIAIWILNIEFTIIEWHHTTHGHVFIDMQRHRCCGSTHLLQAKWTFTLSEKDVTNVMVA